MMQRKVVDGVPYIVVSRYIDRNVEQRIRQMTTFRRGNLGQAVTNLLRKGLKEMDSISPEQRQIRLHKIPGDLGRIVVLIPEDLDHAVRHRAMLWDAPIYRVFSAMLKKGLEVTI